MIQVSVSYFMKKHLLGFFIALTTFFVGFYISPIRFIHSASGLGATSDLLFQCHYSNYFSNHFESVYLWSCNYESTKKAKEIFDKDLNDAIELIEPVTEKKLQNGEVLYRTIILMSHNNQQFYCLIRANDVYEMKIASDSLRHIREFEEQKIVH